MTDTHLSPPSLSPILEPYLLDTECRRTKHVPKQLDANSEPVTHPARPIGAGEPASESRTLCHDVAVTLSIPATIPIRSTDHVSLHAPVSTTLPVHTADRPSVPVTTNWRASPSSNTVPEKRG
jgi:hypothetical protein